MSKDREENQEEKSVSLTDFIIPQKVSAFCDSYTNAETEQVADEVFTDAKLRRYFQAYPRNIGDPLTEYVNLLEKCNFTMRTSISGEPAIFVKLIRTHNSHLLEDTFGKETEPEAE